MAVRCALGGEMTRPRRCSARPQAARARLRCSAGGVRPMGRASESAVRHIMGDAAFDAAYADGGALA